MDKNHLPSEADVVFENKRTAKKLGASQFARLPPVGTTETTILGRKALTKPNQNDYTLIGNPFNDSYGTVGLMTVIIDLGVYNSRYNKLLVDDDIDVAFENLPLGNSIEFTLDITNVIASPVINFISGVVNIPTLPTAIDARYILHFIGIHDTDGYRYTCSDVDIQNAGGGASVPVGTTENDHLEWNNSTLLWERAQILQFGVGAGLHAETGFLNFLNDTVGVAWRNFTDTGDLQMKVDVSNLFDFTHTVNGPIGINVRAQHASDPDNSFNILQFAGVSGGTVVFAPYELTIGVDSNLTAMNLLPAELTMGVDIDMDGNFIKSALYVSSNSATPATDGFIRSHNNTIGIAWRNATDTANLELKGDSSNNFQFTQGLNGTAVSLQLWAQHATDPQYFTIAQTGSISGFTLIDVPTFASLYVDGNNTISFDANSTTFLRDLIMDTGSTNIWLGARYIRFEAMTAPSHTTATTRYLFQDSADNHLKIRTNSGLIDLEGAASFADDVFQIYDNVTPAKILQFSLANLFAGTSFFSSEVLSAIRVWTLPDITGTFIMNSGSQTITGQKKFEHGNLLLEESGGANTGLLVTATLASDRTYTFPDITGTVALLEGTQTFTGAKTFNENIVAGGAGDGMTNVGHIDFIDNLATPASATCIYSDGTDVFVATGGTTINLTDIGNGSFADNVFDIHDNTTPTKILQFQLSDFIAGTSLINSETLTVSSKIWTLPNQTGTFILNAGSQTFTGVKKFEHGNLLIEESGGANTGLLVMDTLSADRTFTFPNTSLMVAGIDVSNSWADGVKQTFNPDATNAGLNFGSFAGDPSTLANGDVWYNSTSGKFRAREAGVTVDMIGGGGSSNSISQLNSNVTVTDTGADGNISIVADGVEVIDIIVSSVQLFTGLDMNSNAISEVVSLSMAGDIDMNNNDILEIKTLVGNDTGLGSFKIIFDGAGDSDTYFTDSATEDRINVYCNNVNTVAFEEATTTLETVLGMTNHTITNCGGMTMSGDIDMNGHDVIELGPDTIALLTEDTAPVATADFVMTYDATGPSMKKVKLLNLPKFGGYNIPHGTTTNGWYSTPHLGTSSIGSTAFSVDFLHGIPFIPMETITIDQLALYCTVAGTGTVDCWMGIYDTKTDGTNYPDQRIARWTAKIALTSTGNKSTTISETTVQLIGGRMYWLAFILENGTTDPSIVSFAPESLIQVLGLQTSEVSDTSGGVFSLRVSSTFSNTDMPSSFPASASRMTSSVNHPFLFLRVASVP